MILQVTVNAVNTKSDLVDVHFFILRKTFKKQYLKISSSSYKKWQSGQNNWQNKNKITSRNKIWNLITMLACNWMISLASFLILAATNNCIIVSNDFNFLLLTNILLLAQNKFLISFFFQLMSLIASKVRKTACISVLWGLLCVVQSVPMHESLHFQLADRGDLLGRRCLNFRYSMSPFRFSDSDFPSKNPFSWHQDTCHNSA